MEQTLNGLNRKSRSFYFWILKHKKVIILVSLLILLPLLFSAGRVLAEESAEDSAIREVLTEYSDLFKLRSIITDFLKALTGTVVYVFYMVVYNIEQILIQVLSFFGFVEFMQETSIYTSLISTLVGVLMAGTLVWIGSKMIINQGQVPQMKTVTQNIIVSFFLILGMPFFMGWLQEGVEIIWSSSETVEDEHLTNTVMNNHFYDLYLPLNSTQDFDDYMSQDNPRVNDIREPSDFDKLELNEFFHPSEHDFEDDKGDSADLLSHTIYHQYDDNNQEEIVVEEIEEAGFFQRLLGDTFETGYYRYQWDTLPLLVALTALGVAFVFVTFTIIMTYVELGFKLLFSPVALATDLETGQRTKQVLHDVINGFLTIAFEIIAFRVFVMYIKWLSDANLHLVLYLVGLVAGAIVLIQGSKTVLRWFGVDTGLSEGFSGFRQFMRFTGASFLGRRLAQGISTSKNKQQTTNQREDLSHKLGEDTSDSDDVTGASKMARDLGYATSRGAKGLARDGASKAGNYLADRTYRPVIDGARGLSEQFGEGREDARMRSESDLRRKESVKSSQLDSVREAISNSNLSESEKETALKEVSKAQGMSPAMATAHIQQVMDNAGLNSPEVQDAIRQIHDEHVPGAVTPESATRQIDEQLNSLQSVVEQSNLPEAQKQQVIQELQEAQNMSPAMATAHIQQVMDNAGLNSPEVQDAIRQIHDEHVPGAVTPESATRQVNEQLNSLQNVVEQSNLPEAQKQQVIQELQEAQNMSPAMATAHIQQVMDNAGLNSPEVQDAIRQIHDEHVPSAVTPESTTRQIDEQLNTIQGAVQQSNLPEAQKQQVIQELQQAQDMSPASASRHIQQVMDNSGVNTPEVQTAIRQIHDVSATELAQPGMATRQINDQLNTIQGAVQQSNLPEAQKQQVIQEVSQAQNMTPESATAHVQQVMDNAGLNTPEVQTAIRQIKDVSASELAQPGMATRQVNDELLNQAQMSAPANRNVIETLSRTNISDLEGSNVVEKQANLRQRVIQESTTPEALEQSINQVVKQSGVAIPTEQVSDLTQRVQTIREEAQQQNLSNEVVKQRVEREVSSALEGGSTSSTETRQVVEQISNASIGQTAPTQRVVSGIESASQATGSQVTRNISRSVIPEVTSHSSVSAPIRREVQEIVNRHTQDTSASPQDIIQNVKQDIQKVDFGQQEDIKQRIIQHVEQSSVANEQQFQNNLRTLSQKEKELAKDDK